MNEDALKKSRFRVMKSTWLVKNHPPPAPLAVREDD
jgi:hypothetical protein